MPSIQSSGWPLAFKCARRAEALRTATVSRETVIRTETRSLDGMQKEAIVHYGPSGDVWRMVCDEGPYLNGTDLAPFPLAFFSTGLAFSFLSEIKAQAAKHGVALASIALDQDNTYTMEGSAIRGDMIGGAGPVTLAIETDADIDEDVIRTAVYEGIAAAPASACLRDVLSNTFSITVNGAQIRTGRVKEPEGALPSDPEHRFDTISPGHVTSYVPDIIEKLEGAKIVHDVEGGAGSSLKSEQKRTLIVRTRAWTRPDGLYEAQVQVLQPIGSLFKFVGDDPIHLGGKARAPDGLSYLSAGVAFCYMTQIGRYAHIVKLDLPSYRIVQDCLFRREMDGTSCVEPFVTHVYLTSPEPVEKLQKLVDMGEQTCFLHAALRGVTKTKLKLRRGPKTPAGSPPGAGRPGASTTESSDSAWQAS